MTDIAVRAAGLRRTFGDTIAVAGVDLDVPRGALFGLLGPDGAGKSTLLRMLATVLAPDAGEATVFGTSVTAHPDQVTPRLGYMSQQFCMYPDLTVAENLDFFATIRGVGREQRRTRAASLLASMGMAEFTGRQAGRLSGGMKQKLMLASTLMHEPDLLLLDEPTTGVDPASRREFWQILAALRAEGRTVLVATPYMDEAERCTDVAFMRAGELTHRGTPREIAGLLPGLVLDIDAADPRAVLAALTGNGGTPGRPGQPGQPGQPGRPGRVAGASGIDGVGQVHLLGDQVRVLWTGGDPDLLVERLQAEGLPVTVHVIDADMEAAFAYLAQAPA